MTKMMVSMILEATLRASLEAAASIRQLDAEGRTELTAEEAARLQQATDAAQAAAREVGDRL